MKSVRLGKNIVVKLPDNFVPVSLPWRNRWIKALRSGKFLQATGGLTGTVETDDDLYKEGYCCLGVLSKIQGRLTDSGEDGGENDTVLSSSNPCFFALSGAKLAHEKFTGKFVVETADDDDCATGIFPEGVKVFHKGVLRRSLAGLNDNGATFETISKVIELLWRQAK